MGRITASTEDLQRDGVCREVSVSTSTVPASLPAALAPIPVRTAVSDLGQRPDHGG